MDEAAELEKFMNYVLPTKQKHALEKLIALVSRPGMMACELGTYAGFTASCILPTIAANQGKMYLVDWFKGNPDAVGIHATDTYRCLDVLERLLENVKEHDRLVTIIMGTTDNAASMFADGIFDYVFIAADHRYSFIKADIQNWWPKVRLGGILSGHALDKRVQPDTKEWEAMIAHCEEDYHDGVHFGVTRAVQEAFPDFNHEAEAIWWVHKDGK